MKAKSSRRRSGTSVPAPLLIKGAQAITQDAAGRVGAFDLRLQDDRIVEVGPRLRRRFGEDVIDGRGMVAIPGLVQAHIHTCQTLFRGLADDMQLLDWLQQRIWPFEGAMTASDVAASARLGMAELLLGGTTAILDMGTVRHGDELFKAAQKLGLRYVGGKTIMDRGQGYPLGLRETTEEALRASVALCERWHGTARGRLRYAFSPRFVLSASEEAVRACVHEARARGALLHTHAAENAEEVQLVRERSGVGNVELLHQLGFTGSDTLLAHCVWLSANERRLLRETGTRVVHCPSANLKLASGIARISEYLDEGIHVALGADGAACNNRLDAFTEMRLAALLHKIRGGPTAVPAARALRLATIDGARALGIPDAGSLEPGMLADLALIDLGRPHMYPDAGDLISRVVYSAQPSDVHTVIIDGRIVVHEGKLLTADVAGILAAAERAAQAVKKRVA